MKLRTRIILAMTALMVASLLVIGSVTIIFFKTQNDKYHQERLARKERAIKTEMMYFSKEVEVQENTDVVIKEFEQEVIRLATVHNMEINVYNTLGDVLVSASPDSGSVSFVNRRVPPAALEQLSMTDRVVLPETKGDQNLLSDYTLLRNNKGERIGILHLPYQRNQNVSQNDLQGFLGSIGLTYLFLFLAAMILTIILSNSITKNLALLVNRMHSVDLSKKNEPLSWKKNDEIGQLVIAYNEMLHKLEESRDLLAKTEREGAWREMARQVAHEIKNPLTPIKLSIQHLQATADYDAQQWQEKFSKTMGMVIQQIESLNTIASEFSDFAKMPRAKLETVNVAEAVRDVELLFAEAPFHLVTQIESEKPLVVIDPDGLRRVLGNLVKNAKHAVADTKDAQVTIRLKEVNHKLHLEVEDNGTGIPHELKSKIFQPNFTTKSSGTGLGLAICQQIIEQAEGRIWFESEEGTFTRFVIEFPLASTPPPPTAPRIPSS